LDELDIGVRRGGNRRLRYPDKDSNTEHTAALMEVMQRALDVRRRDAVRPFAPHVSYHP
jgi:hypothetical protein